MKFIVKEGACIAYLDKRLSDALPLICNAWYRITPTLMTITSGRDGKHSPKSLHYEGRAIDLRVWGLSAVQRQFIVMEIKETLGPSYDVIDEGDHIHVELDRRADA